MNLKKKSNSYTIPQNVLENVLAFVRLTYTMYTVVARSLVCGVALLGVVSTVGCGDDDDTGTSSDPVMGTACVLNSQDMGVPLMDIGPQGCRNPSETSCVTQGGGTLVRVCHLPGADPTLTPAAPAAVGAAQSGVWSSCCCAQGTTLTCTNPAGVPVTTGAGTTGGGGTGGGPRCGNGVVDVGEDCDGNAGLAAHRCPSGVGLVTCTPQCIVDMGMCPGQGGAATGG